MNKNRIWIWIDDKLNKSSDTPSNFPGLELFFNEKDAGSFGVYRFLFRHQGGQREVSVPFSILVEGIFYLLIANTYLYLIIIILSFSYVTFFVQPTAQGATSMILNQ